MLAVEPVLLARWILILFESGRSAASEGSRWCLAYHAASNISWQDYLWMTCLPNMVRARGG